MTKTKLFAIVIAFSIFSCTHEEQKSTIEPQNIETIKIKDPLTVEQINVVINQYVSSGNQFYWSSQNNHFIWSAIKNGNELATIGFGNSKNDFDRSKLSNHNAIENTILQTIARIEGTSIDKILIQSDPFLNLIDVKITKQETILALSKLNTIRYIEPADYKFMETSTAQFRSSSSSGCGLESSVISSLDAVNTTPNAKIPWNFFNHNIPAAWGKSTGQGITVGVVDTGLSTNQSLMNGSFNNGLSSGRSVQRFGTFVDSFWPWSTTTDGSNDKCGHGTSMASVATAPRNDRGLPVGVAYNANLISYRAASDVLLEGYHEQNGVKNAFTSLGNNANVKIISMSMGYIFSVGKIEDGIRYAYNRGKLIFCAGGTSTTFTTFVGVIFPAWMSEAVAITGVKDSNTFQKCDVCHTGNKIDFTVVMERASNNNHVPILSYYDAQADYVGGSSVATATTAGIAALIWSKNPTWNKDQVLLKMKQSATFYPTKNSSFGHGNINVSLAVQ